MTTKKPSPVEEAPSTSLEKIAYGSVESIATEEPNDRYRLGYHVWRWMTEKRGTLEEAVAESGARMQIPQADAVRIIRESLVKNGITG
jgi:hypothetical protein